MENAEKSNNSSFEDLSNLNDGDIIPQTTADDKKPTDDIIDIIGNGQLTKRIIQKSDSEIQPQRGDLVKVNLIGKLEDGTVFEDVKNMEIHVGDFEVVFHI